MHCASRGRPPWEPWCWRAPMVPRTDGGCRLGRSEQGRQCGPAPHVCAAHSHDECAAVTQACLRTHTQIASERERPHASAAGAPLASTATLFGTHRHATAVRCACAPSRHSLVEFMDFFGGTAAAGPWARQWHGMCRHQTRHHRRTQPAPTSPAQHPAQPKKHKHVKAQKCKSLEV